MVSRASDQLEAALGLCCSNKYSSFSWYEFRLSWNSFVSNVNYRFVSTLGMQFLLLQRCFVACLCVMCIHCVLCVHMYVIYSSGIYGRLTPTSKQDVALIPQRLHLVCNWN